MLELQGSDGLRATRATTPARRDHKDATFYDYAPNQGVVEPSHRQRVTFSSTQPDCDSPRSAIYLAATISLPQVEPPDVLMPRRN